MTTFDDEGFLSDEMLEIVGQFEKRDPALHALCRELNARAKRHIRDTPVALELQSLLCALYFGRMLSLFSAVYLLIGRGLRVEAEMLLRTMTEVHFKLHFSAASFANAKKLIATDSVERLRMLKNTMRHPPSNRTPEETADLQKLVAELEAHVKNEPPEKFSTRDIALAIGMAWKYDLKYARFSQSTHSSPRDLQANLHTDTAGKITGLLWGPDHRDAAFWLATALDFLAQALTVTPFRAIDPQSPEYLQWQARITDVFRRVDQDHKS